MLTQPMPLVLLRTRLHVQTWGTISEAMSLQIHACMLVQGTITTVSDVKPLVTVAAYTDVETGHELYQEVRKDFS